jgi:hypothetical protein
VALKGRMQITVEMVVDCLRTTAPSLSVVRTRIDDIDRLVLPANPDDDYYWEVRFLPEGAHVHARLTRFSEKDYYFWYWPFDEWDYGSREEHLGSLLNRLCTLITHNTRITQKTGYLCWTFVCHAWVDQRWAKVSANSGWKKPSVFVPPADVRIRTYFARPISEEATCLTAGLWKA